MEIKIKGIRKQDGDIIFDYEHDGKKEIKMKEFLGDDKEAELLFARFMQYTLEKLTNYLIK